MEYRDVGTWPSPTHPQASSPGQLPTLATHVRGAQTCPRQGVGRALGSLHPYNCQAHSLPIQNKKPLPCF